MTDRTADIASLIKRHRSADRIELLRAILAHWPDISGHELQAAIDLHRARPLLVLARPRPVEHEEAQA